MSSPRSLIAASCCLAFAAVALAPAPAEAIPAFARKYQTSCQTCHVAYPKLNAFGEAYRLRGYRMPGETEEMIQEKPVSLGAPAWKRMWPRAVWPSDIPGSVPLAMRLNLPIRWESSLDEGRKSLIQADFQFPGVAYIQGAGTLGETFSFFTKLQITRAESAELVGGEIRRSEEVELDMEHAELHVNDLLGPEGALNLKIGRFEPELVGSSFSHMRTLTDRNYVSIFGFDPLAPGGGSTIAGDGHGHGGAGGIAVPTTVEGIEAYGVFKHRLLWNVGIANGLGPGFEGSDGNALKDVYARLTYKFGGMGLDGTTAEGVAPPGADKPWRDDSVKIGVFAYRGDGEDVIFTLAGHGHDDGDEHDDGGGHDDDGDEHDDGDGHDDDGDEHDDGDGHDDDGEHDDDGHGDEEPPGGALVVPLEDESFLRYGADLHWYHGDLHLFAVYVRGEDDLRTYDSAAWALDPGTLVLLEDRTFEYESYFVEADYVLRPWLHAALRYERLDPANASAANYEWAIANLTALIRANIKAYVEIQQDLKIDDNYAVVLAVDFAY